MGGRGASIGGGGGGAIGSVANYEVEASQYIKNKGYSRYDRIEQPKVSLTASNRYDEAVLKIRQGEELSKIKGTKKTHTEMKQLNEYAKLSNAKRLIGMNGDVQEYLKTKKVLKKIDKLLK